MKIKNKKRLIVFLTLYIVGYLYFCIFGGINYGMKISDNPALDIMIRSSGLPVGVLFAIVGVAIGITYFVQKKNGVLNSYEAFSDIMTEDEFERWQKRKNKIK